MWAYWIRVLISLDAEIMIACAGGLDHTRGAARPSGLGSSQHYQGIPWNGPEASGDEESPDTLPGSAGVLQDLQRAASTVGRAKSTPLVGLLPLVLFLLLQLCIFIFMLPLFDDLEPLSCQQAVHIR